RPVRAALRFLFCPYACAELAGGEARPFPRLVLLVPNLAERSPTGREACRMQGRGDRPSIAGSRPRRSFPCRRHGASGSRSPGSMSRGPRIVFMNNGVLLAFVLAGDHDAEFVVNLEKDDRHHQRVSQVEGMVLSEGEIVRHRKAPVLRR